MTGSYTSEESGEIVFVTGLEAACAALRAARAHSAAVTIVGDAGGAGAGWWVALERQARAAVPGADATFVLDCADEAGRALEAIRAGASAVAVSLAPETGRRIAEIAAAAGCRVVALPGPEGAEGARHHESGNIRPARGVAKPERVG